MAREIMGIKLEVSLGGLQFQIALEFNRCINKEALKVLLNGMLLLANCVNIGTKMERVIFWGVH